MSEQNQTPQTARQYEGPARLLSGNHNEQMLRETGHGPSFADHLTNAYGAEDTGWEFDTQEARHADTNSLEEATHEPEFKVATEGLGNFMKGRGYTTNSGESLDGKVERRAHMPKTGNILVTPDGDMHRADKHPQ